MKNKIKMQQRNGQISADYFAIVEKALFRPRLWQKVLEGAGDDAVLMVDTNQCTADIPTDGLVDALKNAGLEPMVMAISANPKSLLGFNYTPKKKRESERLIVVELKGRCLTAEAVSALLLYDVALGFAPNKPLTEVCERLRVGTPLFGSGCFERELYDSILCTVVRSSFDISVMIKETTDEMGI